MPEVVIELEKNSEDESNPTELVVSLKGGSLFFTLGSKTGRYSNPEKFLQFPKETVEKKLKDYFGEVGIDGENTLALVKQVLENTFDNVVNYFVYLFGYFGRIVSQEIMESLALAKLQKDISLCNWMNQSRIRKNSLLTGAHGFFKTTILRIFYYGLLKDNKVLRIRLLTSLTRSALLGSIRESKKTRHFYPPEVKLSDIIINLELSTLDVEDKEFIGNFQSLLEDGVVRYALIKFANPSDEIIKEAKNYGVSFEAGRLCYETDVTLWSSTHTTDFLPSSLKETFLDRFIIVEVPKHLSKDIFSPKYVLDVIFHKKRNYAFENMLASMIQKTLKDITITKEQFELACAVAEEVFREALKLNINLCKLFNARLVSEVLKSGIAFLAWHPKATKTELKEYLKDKPLRYSQAKLPLDDVTSFFQNFVRISFDTASRRLVFYILLLK